MHRNVWAFRSTRSTFLQMVTFHFSWWTDYMLQNVQQDMFESRTYTAYQHNHAWGVPTLRPPKRTESWWSPSEKDKQLFYHQIQVSGHVLHQYIPGLYLKYLRFVTKTLYRVFRGNSLQCSHLCTLNRSAFNWLHFIHIAYCYEHVGIICK